MLLQEKLTKLLLSPLGAKSRGAKGPEQESAMEGPWNPWDWQEGESAEGKPLTGVIINLWANGSNVTNENISDLLNLIQK